ncbi:hypothetical protein, partial [Micrococcus luteus]|uniref:hypothetical protein n=1 Tax=Micrococcus luteus TaxID=1270 RepID=UPI0033F0D533
MIADVRSWGLPMGDDRSVPEGFDRMVRELAEVYQRRSLQRKKGSLRHLRDQALPIFACVEDKLVLDPVARRGEPHPPLVLTMLASHLQPEGANAPHAQVPHLLVPLKDTSPPKGPDAQPGDVEADEVAELV